MEKCTFCEKDIHNNNLKYCSISCRINYRKEYMQNYNLLHPNIQKIRFWIFTRDNFRCMYCGLSSIEDNIKLEVDHIIPKSKNNKTLQQLFQENKSLLVTCCQNCNLGKNKTELPIEIFNRIQQKLII